VIEQVIDLETVIVIERAKRTFERPLLYSVAIAMCQAYRDKESVKRR
jgi:hypothetical protein